MSDLSIFKIDSQTINIKDTTARQTADSAKTLATTASGNATTALNKINELGSEIGSLNSSIMTINSSLDKQIAKVTTVIDTANISSCAVYVTRRANIAVINAFITTKQTVAEWKDIQVCNVGIIPGYLLGGYGVAFGQTSHGLVQLYLGGTNGNILCINTRGGDKVADAYLGQLVVILD